MAGMSRRLFEVIVNADSGVVSQDLLRMLDADTAQCLPLRPSQGSMSALDTVKFGLAGPPLRWKRSGPFLQKGERHDTHDDSHMDG